MIMNQHFLAAEGEPVKSVSVSAEGRTVIGAQ
jgi:hypothetical protein